MNHSIAAINERINELATEAASYGDSDMVEMCERADGRVLRDARNGALVLPEDLWGETPTVYYVRAICASLDAASEAGAVHGDIDLMGITVYAA